ncbi:hypothetical protein CPB84DRAFT_1758064, partial [Gymnopilus junonius]
MSILCGFPLFLSLLHPLIFICSPVPSFLFFFFQFSSSLSADSLKFYLSVRSHTSRVTHVTPLQVFHPPVRTLRFLASSVQAASRVSTIL